RVINSLSGLPSPLLCIFPLRETFCVSTSASDHTRSLFNDRGGFTPRHISHRKNPSRKFYSQNLDQYDSFAKLGSSGNSRKSFTKKPGRTCPRSAISARPHFPLEEPSSAIPYRPSSRQFAKRW